MMTREEYDQNVRWLYYAKNKIAYLERGYMGHTLEPEEIASLEEGIKEAQERMKEYPYHRQEQIIEFIFVYGFALLLASPLIYLLYITYPW